MNELILALFNATEQDALDHEVYLETFSKNPSGSLVLNELASLFWINPSSNKELTAEQISYINGQRSVLTHIINAIIETQRPVEDNNND